MRLRLRAFWDATSGGFVDVPNGRNPPDRVIRHVDGWETWTTSVPTTASTRASLHWQWYSTRSVQDALRNTLWIYRRQAATKQRIPA